MNAISRQKRFRGNDFAHSHLTFAADMKNDLPYRSSRPVAIWLLAGVFMIIVQVLLGGITRLTGSGLSITEWKPILGALPPTNDQEWNAAFEKYKQIAQYKYVNFYFTLSDFKSIYFWEWFHRLWARLIGVAFIIPFAVFIVRKQFQKEMIRPLLILFLLGALQGLVGWIMVKSGLEDPEMLYVSHYRLAIHFILALGVLCYALWFALQLLVPPDRLVHRSSLRRFTGWIIALLILQLIYGAFMAGLKAAQAAPTWPSINGTWLPGDLHSFGNRSYPGISFLFDHPLVVHFIHRNLAYLITVLILVWASSAFKTEATPLWRRWRLLPLLLVLAQVTLGIFTVINSYDQKKLLWLGVAHQFTAMLLLLSLTAVMFMVRRDKGVKG